MSNRFKSKKKYNFALLRSLVTPVLCFVAAASLFVWGLDGLTRKTRHEQLASVESAVTRAAVQCYSIEGQYPSGIKYLQERYGLAVDLDKYIVDYRVFASNVMPDITVLPRNFTGEEQEIQENEPPLSAEDFEALDMAGFPIPGEG